MVPGPCVCGQEGLHHRCADAESNAYHLRLLQPGNDVGVVRGLATKVTRLDADQFVHPSSCHTKERGIDYGANFRIRRLLTSRRR